MTRLRIWWLKLREGIVEDMLANSYVLANEHRLAIEEIMRERERRRTQLRRLRDEITILENPARLISDVR